MSWIEEKSHARERLVALGLEEPDEFLDGIPPRREETDPWDEKSVSDGGGSGADDATMETAFDENTRFQSGCQLIDDFIQTLRSLNWDKNNPYRPYRNYWVMYMDIMTFSLGYTRIQIDGLVKMFVAFVKRATTMGWPTLNDLPQTGRQLEGEHERAFPDMKKFVG